MRLILAAALALSSLAVPAAARDGAALYNAQCKSLAAWMASKPGFDSFYAMNPLKRH
jgi:hypothetical protein